jgi:long-subunit acyl-CoA synthetase (AMP-forming)
VNLRLYSNSLNFTQQVSCLRPSAMACPPRIWNGLFALFCDTLAAFPDRSPELIEDEIFELFGDRISFLVTGGAPTAPKINKFIRNICNRRGVGFADSYGATECGAITNDGYSIQKYGKTDFVQIRLVAIESLHVEGGEEIGAVGEIVVQSPSMSVGYYCDEVSTSASFVDGWFRTGDLGRWGPAKRLIILGRVANAIIGQSGVFCPGTIEAFLISESSFAEQIFVDFTAKNDLRMAVTIKQKYRNLSDSELRERMMSEWVSADKEGNVVHLLPKSEDAFVIEREIWSNENGLETAQMKEARGLLRQKYFGEKVVGN